MSENVPSLSQLIERMPQKLQVRFDSLGNYVLGIIEEIRHKQGGNIKLSQDDIRLIQLAVLVYSLDDFFRLGTKAAKGASEIFEKFQLEGFRVGNTEFTKDNKDTLRGEDLANKLRSAISQTHLAIHIAQAKSVNELVANIVKGLTEDE